MANTSSAKKAARQNEKRRVQNLSRRTAIKSAIKKVHAAIEAKKVDAAKVDQLLKDVAAKLSRAKSKGVMHRNTASRKLGRLTKIVNKATQPAA